jgi:hypothetical protein
MSRHAGPEWAQRPPFPPRPNYKASRVIDIESMSLPAGQTSRSVSSPLWNVLKHFNIIVIRHGPGSLPQVFTFY